MFTSIQGASRREILIFWLALPLNGGTPVLAVWTGGVMPDEEPILFDTGGTLSDLGEVHVLTD